MKLKEYLINKVTLPSLKILNIQIFLSYYYYFHKTQVSLISPITKVNATEKDYL